MKKGERAEKGGEERARDGKLLLPVAAGWSEQGRGMAEREKSSGAAWVTVRLSPSPEKWRRGREKGEGRRLERGGDRGALPPLDDGLAGQKKEEGGAAQERERECGGCQGEGEKNGLEF